MVDVVTDTEIHASVDEVADYACDPDNATSWYRNIESVRWKTARPLAVGTQVTFVAHFLARRLEYTYEVVEFVPGARFVMRTAQGPFPMETTYTFEPISGDATLMTLRNRGEPSGFAKLAAPFMAAAMRRANRADLARLKEILESSSGETPL